MSHRVAIIKMCETSHYDDGETTIQLVAQHITDFVEVSDEEFAILKKVYSPYSVYGNYSASYRYYLVEEVKDSAVLIANTIEEYLEAAKKEEQKRKQREAKAKKEKEERDRKKVEKERKKLLGSEEKEKALLEELKKKYEVTISKE
jgi:hypothetical protein